MAVLPEVRPADIKQEAAAAEKSALDRPPGMHACPSRDANIAFYSTNAQGATIDRHRGYSHESVVDGLTAILDIFAAAEIVRVIDQRATVVVDQRVEFQSTIDIVVQRATRIVMQRAVTPHVGVVVQSATRIVERAVVVKFIIVVQRAPRIVVQRADVVHALQKTALIVVQRALVGKSAGGFQVAPIVQRGPKIVSQSAVGVAKAGPLHGCSECQNW